MTIETCYKRLELAKASEDKEQIDFWEARIANKIARHAKYNTPKEETKSKKGK